MTENEALTTGKVLYENITSNANNIILTNKYIKFVEIAIQALEENQEYKELGTVEKFKTLKENNEPKKPINYDKHYYKCSTCDKDLGVDVDSIYIYKEIPPKYCCNCGQRLDWS